MSFEAFLGFTGSSATIYLSGELTDADVPVLRSLLDQALSRDIDRLVVKSGELTGIAAGGVRCLAFAQQRLPAGGQILLEGVSERVRGMLASSGIEGAVTLVESGATG